MRFPGRRYLLVGALSALAVGALLVAAPSTEAKTAARSVSVKISASDVNVGQKVTFSGKATQTAKGSAVKIQALSGKKWKTLTTTKTTNTKGSYKATITDKRAGHVAFRVDAPRHGSRKAVVSGRVFVNGYLKSTVSVDNPGSVTVGSAGRVVLSGRMSPFKAGSKVALQRRSVNGSWIAAGSAVLGATGRFTVSSPVLAAGSVTVFRVMVADVSWVRGGVSRSVTVTVRAGAGGTGGGTGTSSPGSPSPTPPSGTVPQVTQIVEEVSPETGLPDENNPSVGVIGSGLRDATGITQVTFTMDGQPAVTIAWVSDSNSALRYVPIPDAFIAVMQTNVSYTLGITVSNSNGVSTPVSYVYTFTGTHPLITNLTKSEWVDSLFFNTNGVGPLTGVTFTVPGAICDVDVSEIYHGWINNVFQFMVDVPDCIKTAVGEGNTVTLVLTYTTSLGDVSAPSSITYTDPYTIPSFDFSGDGLYVTGAEHSASSNPRAGTVIAHAGTQVSFTVIASQATGVTMTVAPRYVTDQTNPSTKANISTELPAGLTAVTDGAQLTVSGTLTTAAGGLDGGQWQLVFTAHSDVSGLDTDGLYEILLIVTPTQPLLWPNSPGQGTYYGDPSCTDNTESCTIEDINYALLTEGYPASFILPDGYADMSEKDQVIALVNEIRAIYGIYPTPLVEDPDMSAAAQQDADTFTHLGHSTDIYGGALTPVQAIFGLMYYDGFGGMNATLATSGSGAFGHRAISWLPATHIGVAIAADGTTAIWVK